MTPTRTGSSGRNGAGSRNSSARKRRSAPGRSQTKKRDSVRQTIAQKPARRRGAKMGRIDISFFFLIVVLVTIGLIMVFSASYATSLNENDSGLYLVLKQTAFVAAGLVIMYVLSYIPYQLYLKTYKLIYFVCLALTAAALLFTGKGNARRWIRLGSFTFQPSELMKFALIIVFAALISKNYRQMNTFKKGVLEFFLYLVPVLGIIALQRHMSCILLMIIICGGMMYIAGSKIYYLAALIPIGLVALVILQLMGFDYVTTRVDTWLNPFAGDITGDAWQTVQGLYAIGSGGLFGVGLGNSTQKFLWVSEPQNDFIFAIVCEELGLIGALTIILLFILFVASGFSIAMRAPDKFSAMVVIGVVLQFGAQALLNIAVVTNAMPNTGISLPFFSAGGTATLMQLAQMGVVLNISRHCRPTIAKNKEIDPGKKSDGEQPPIRIISSRDV
jgi:cell division protein FtsW